MIGPAQGPAELVLVTARRIEESCSLIQIAARVEDVIVVEQEGRAMEAIRTRFRNDVDDRAGGAAIFGRKLICQQAKFLHHIRIVDRLLRAGDARDRCCPGHRT